MDIMMKMMRKNKKGFTLVEIIVVLVILAILAAILIPSMVGWINKANDKTAIVEARTILLAAQTIASENYKTYQTATNLTAADITAAIALAGVGGNITASTVTGGQIVSLTVTSAATSGSKTVDYTQAGGFVITA